VADIKQFSLQLDQFKDDVRISMVRLQKQVAFDLFRRIIKRTPKDTGRAQASWTIALNQPNRAVQPAGRKSYPLPKVPPIKNTVGDTIWISNNLPYIERLEHGYSTQAPLGMVALSVEEVRNELEVLKQTVLRENRL
jgi:hypothetical protein